MSSDDPRELLGAYAIGALEPEEQARVDALLLRDQDARAELHALQLGAAWLARSDIRPSEQVWERIRDEVEADRADGPATADTEVEPPVSLTERRRRRVRQLVAVAAVVAAGVIGTSVILDTDAPEGVSVAAAARAAMLDPSTRQVELLTSDGEVAAELVVYPDGRGYVVDAALSPLGEGSTYQLWAITPAGAVSQGVLGRSPSAAEMHGATGERATRYAITIEQQGGSPTPKGPLVARSDFASA